MTAIEFNNQLIGLEKSLYKHANSLRVRGADAKDLVQETFLRVLMNKEKFVDKGYLKAWTFTIMRNTFINNYRSDVRHNTRNNIDVTLFIDHKQAPKSDCPDSTYSFKEMSERISKMNEKLGLPFRMYIEGYKYQEIADIMKIKLGTVKNRIFLARQELMILVQ